MDQKFSHGLPSNPLSFQQHSSHCSVFRSHFFSPPQNLIWRRKERYENQNWEDNHAIWWQFAPKCWQSYPREKESCRQEQLPAFSSFSFLKHFFPFPGSYRSGHSSACERETLQENLGVCLEFVQLTEKKSLLSHFLV